MLAAAAWVTLCCRNVLNCNGRGPQHEEIRFLVAHIRPSFDGGVVPHSFSFSPPRSRGREWLTATAPQSLAASLPAVAGPSASRNLGVQQGHVLLVVHHAPVELDPRVRSERQLLRANYQLGWKAVPAQ